MKTAVTSLTVAVFVFLFSFQNCQKSPHPDEIGSLALNTVVSENSVDFNQESVESVSFILQDSKSVTKAGNTYQINYNIILNTDLNTGIIVETNDLDTDSDKVTVNYCLSESLKDELVSILKSSQVCTTQPNLREDMVCTQALQPPYAQVFTDREQYDLGSASDGCGNNSIDLCTKDQSDLLKGYIENVKKQYKQYPTSCN